MTKEQMMTRQNAEATQMNEMLSKVPLKIYITDKNGIIW
jgi:hypothetical protein